MSLPFQTELNCSVPFEELLKTIGVSSLIGAETDHSRQRQTVPSSVCLYVFLLFMTREPHEIEKVA